MITRYVCGFLFHDDNVLLVRKNRPDWQAGLLNGVGGKCEGHETPHFSMVREFQETDLGLSMAGNFKLFATEYLAAGSIEVYYFRASVSRDFPRPTQRHVNAILDIADDGTLAGVELIDNMPPPPSNISAAIYVATEREDVLSDALRQLAGWVEECGSDHEGRQFALTEARAALNGGLLTQSPQPKLPSEEEIARMICCPTGDCCDDGDGKHCFVNSSIYPSSDTQIAAQNILALLAPSPTNGDHP